MSTAISIAAAVLSATTLSVSPAASFSVSPLTRRSPAPLPNPYVPSQAWKTSTSLRMAASPDLNSEDPFVVLGMEPTSDKKSIKRAYKRMALKYHPDVSTTKDSSPQEKKKASDRFAKINWAYEMLSGKTGTSSSSSSQTSTSSGWTPPHRRTGSYRSTTSSSSSSVGASTDWRDYIPNYGASNDPDQYDAGGDSFGAIFSDLFQGAAGAAAAGGVGGSGIFKDFVEFLEDTVDGYGSSGGSSSSSNRDDADLQYLLQTGSLTEVGEEMDDTELVVQQLSSKRKSVADELIMLQAELAAATRFSEKIGLQERVEELQARKKVVDNYISKARKRLLALQPRYKQLIVKGDNDPQAGGRSRSDTGSYDYQQSRWNEQSSRDTEASPRASTGSSSNEDAWKDEGFGSFGRGRGSSRRRSSSRRRTTSASSEEPTSASSRSSSSSSSPYKSSSGSTYRPSSTPPSSSSPQPSEPYVPPHRRNSSSFDSRAEEDKKRMRELQVEDEFNKLKKELGM